MYTLHPKLTEAYHRSTRKNLPVNYPVCRYECEINVIQRSKVLRKGTMAKIRKQCEHPHLLHSGDKHELLECKSILLWIVVEKLQQVVPLGRVLPHVDRLWYNLYQFVLCTGV